MSDSQKTLEVLHDHYKDTFEQTKSSISQRDRYFFYIVFLISILLFQYFAPVMAETAVNDFLKGKFGLNSPIDLSYISSLIWLTLLMVAIKYFQTVIVIERYFDYTWELEEILRREFKNAIFTREGKYYSGSFRLFSNWARIIYQIVFPILLILVVIVKIVDEIHHASSVTALLLLNIAFVLSILVSTGLYLRAIHSGN